MKRLHSSPEKINEENSDLNDFSQIERINYQVPPFPINSVSLPPQQILDQTLFQAHVYPLQSFQPIPYFSNPEIPVVNSSLSTNNFLKANSPKHKKRKVQPSNELPITNIEITLTRENNVFDSLFPGVQIVQKGKEVTFKATLPEKIKQSDITTIRIIATREINFREPKNIKKCDPKVEEFRLEGNVLQMHVNCNVNGESIDYLDFFINTNKKQYYGNCSSRILVVSRATQILTSSVISKLFWYCSFQKDAAREVIYKTFFFKSSNFI